MPEYCIAWEIELTADNPVEAALKARKIQRDPSSDALVFDAQKHHRIDLKYGIVAEHPSLPEWIG